jgi:putative metalloprotease
MKTRKLIYFVIAIFSIFYLSGCNFISSQMPSMDGLPGGEAVSIGKDLVKAATLTDEEVAEYAKLIAQELDSQNNIAPAGSSYDKRLRKLASNYEQYDGLNLNYKVYLSPEVNAFALPDGSIRFYSGLMDRMDDEQFLSVVGHEIGHVHYGHSKKRIQRAHAMSGALKAASAGLESATPSTVGGAATAIGGEMLAKMAAAVLKAKLSQGDELEADEYGAMFLAKNGYNPYSSMTALEKLMEMEVEGGKKNDFMANFLSTHPRTDLRVEHVKNFIKDNGLDKGGFSAPATTGAGYQTASFHAVGSSHSVQSGKWYIQLAAFPESEAADSMKAALATSGEKALTRDAVVNGIQYRRVLVGPYSSSSEAARDLGRVTDLGIFDGTPFYRMLAE